MILYEIVQKTGDTTFTRQRVHTLSMPITNGLQELYATILLKTETASVKDKQTLLVDEENVWLFQSTNTFDSTGALIFHGHILKDKDEKHFEVMAACGSYFIVDRDAQFGDRKDVAVMLTDDITRKLTIVGDIIKDTKLVEMPVDETIFTPKQ